MNIKQEIDLFKIDTERAKQLFSQERVRMRIFEYHNVCMWERIHLVDVLQSLEKKGFSSWVKTSSSFSQSTSCLKVHEC